FEEAAMVEPLAVGIYSVKRAQAEPGHTALVLGSGPIGLVTIQALIARGITEVIATDIYDYRLRKAQDMGAKYVFNGQNPDLRKAVREVTGGKGVDLVFETAGSVPTTQQTVDFSNQGARIVLIGLPSQSHFDFPIIETIAKELDILGIFRYANVYKGCVDLLNAGKVNLKPLITHRFSLENTQQALEFAHEHKAESIKAVINL
ncbi:MAG TPA: zinc-binding dehydrogenase, partial [Atribacteraceae bacterium]|nr:zinc-binding dehydrogenase [Atribacteraceae bacterium]